MTALAWILFGIWLLLFGQELLNLASVPKLQSGSPNPPLPLVSVIIPARHEAAVIERTVRGFLSQDYHPLEVIVVDDRSGDGTAEVLKRITDDRLTIVAGEELPPGWLGKPWAIHQGSQKARGALLLFVDADVIYARAAVSALMKFFLARQVGLLSVFPRLEMRGFWENLLMPWLALIGFVFFPTWLAHRSRSHLLAIGGGPGNLIRRTTYDEIGGHRSLRNAIVDDVGLARRVRRMGHHTLMVRGEAFVSLRMYQGFPEIVDGFTKNSAPAFNNNIALIAVLVLISLVVHLFPLLLMIASLAHWLSSGSMPIAAGIAIATVLLISMIRMILFAALDYRMDSAIFGHPIMVVAFIYILLRSAWQLGVRRKLQWRGREYSASGLRFG